MDFSLPEATLPLKTSPYSNKKPTEQEDEIPLRKWQRYNQKKLVRLNKNRSYQLMDANNLPRTTKALDLLQTGLKGQLLNGQISVILESLVQKFDKIQTVSRLSGALTNCIFLVDMLMQDESLNQLLVRVYGEGSDELFSRDREFSIMLTLSLLDVGPHVLGQFANGRLEEYLQGARTLEPKDMVKYNQQVAACLYEVHSLVGLLPGSVSEEARKIRQTSSGASMLGSLVKTEVWDRMWSWYELALNALPVLLVKYPQYKVQLQALQLPALRSSLDALAKQLSQVDSPIVFCHCDSQSGNIMETVTENGKKSLVLIDYEYSCYNYRGYDIANHFCEFMADYHSKEPHLLHADRYPSVVVQNEFIHAYLDARDQYLAKSVAVHNVREANDGSPQLKPPPITHLMNSAPSPMMSPSLSPMLTPVQRNLLLKKEVEMIEKEVALFLPCSHLLWALWGLFQAKSSVIDFDYVAYALQRFAFFQQTRPK